MGRLALSVIGAGWSGVSHRLGQVASEQDHEAVWVNAGPLESDVAYGALRALVGTDPPADHHATADLLDAAVGDRVLVVDNAHHLDEHSIRCLAAVVERGRPALIGRRPSTSAGLAALDEVISRSGRIEHLGRLDVDELATVLALSRETAVDDEVLGEVHRRSGGHVGLALAIFDDDGALIDESPDVVARVERELQKAGPGARSVAELLALASAPPDDVVCQVTGITPDELRAAAEALDTAGLTIESLQLAPEVRNAARASLTAADRRSTHGRLARALLDRGGEAIEAAEHLLAAGAAGDETAAVFARAGDDLRFRDPDEALVWYDEALRAGAEPGLVAAGRAEAAAYAGERTGDATTVDDSPSERARLIAVRAAEACRDGRLERSAQLYEQIEGHPRLSGAATDAFAAVAHAGVGRFADRVGEAPDPLDERAAVAAFLRDALFVHASDPRASAPLFVEAAEGLERLDLDFVLPDSSHALGALCLCLSGDLPAAEALLQRAAASETAGPALQVRHRLLTAFVHLRSARYELPTKELAELDPADLDGRDRLVHAALRAGLARRSGDVPALRQAWADAEAELLRGTADLFHLEPLSELVLAAVRLRQTDRAEPVLEALGNAVAAAPEARAWTVATAWLDVERAVEGDGDADAAAEARDRLVAIDPATPAQATLQEAAASWCDILVERIDPDSVIAVATDLAGWHLPWEASRLAGQAAVRSSDPATARRLLEQARQFHHDPDSPVAAGGGDAGLTAREVDVARFVLDGLTYREIGSQLYISPKTVEHHVARIRRKVQANTRAEMLAALRALFSDKGEDETVST